MEATGKKALVFGTGISGTGAAKLLRAQKAEVILYDGNEDLDKERLRESFGRDEKGIVPPLGYYRGMCGYGSRRSPG